MHDSLADQDINIVADRRPGLWSVEYDRSDGEENLATKKPSDNLWERAYEALKNRDTNLIEAYEHTLVAESTDHPAMKDFSPRSKLIQTMVQSKLEDREAERLMISLGTKSLKVREFGDKIIKCILWAQKDISTAVSAQPFAALAWAGVSVSLSVRNTITQNRIDEY